MTALRRPWLLTLALAAAPLAEAAVPDSGVVWVPQSVRWPVDPEVVTPAPPFVPADVRERAGVVEVGPGKGAAFFLDGLEIARVRVVSGSGTPRFRRVFGGSRSAIQTGLKAIVDTGALRDGTSAWRLVEPPGDGDVWVVDADAPVRVAIEHPRTLPARLAWEDARAALLHAIDVDGPLPELPGDEGASELQAVLEAQAAVGAALVARGGEALVPAVRAWRKAAALRALDEIRPFAWPYWSVTDVGASAGDGEFILRVDGDVASRARWRRVDATAPIEVDVRGPGILRVQSRAILQPGWLVAPAPTTVRVFRDGVLASTTTYTGRPARVANRSDESFPNRQLLITRDGEWAGKIDDLRIPLSPGDHRYTVEVDQPSLARVSRAERKPFLGELLAGTESAEDWVAVGREGLDGRTGPEADLLRALIAHVQGEPPPSVVRDLPPGLQTLAEVLAASHGLLEPSAQIPRWTANLAGADAPPWAWWLRVEIAGLVPEGEGVRALFAAADDLPPAGLMASAATRLGAPGLYQDRPDRGLGALELAWRALPGDRTVRAVYLRQFLDGATWSRITPVVLVNGDAVTPPPMTWLDTAAATGGPVSRAARVYYRIPGGSTRTYTLEASPVEPKAPASLIAFVRSPADAGVVGIGIDDRPFKVLPLADVERLEFAVPAGSHAVTLAAPPGTDAWVSGTPEAPEWRQPEDIATVRSYWPSGARGAVPRFEIPAPHVPVPVRVELRALDPASRPRTVRATIKSDSGAEWPVTLVPGTGDPTLLPIGGESPLSSVATVTVYPPPGTTQLWVEAPEDAGLVVSMSVRRTEMGGRTVGVGGGGTLDELTALGKRLAANPGDGAALLRRADVLAQLGDVEMARQDLRRLLRLGDAVRAQVGDEAIDQVSERIDNLETSRWFAPQHDLAAVTGPVPISAELIVAEDGLPPARVVELAKLARTGAVDQALAGLASLDGSAPGVAWMRGRLLRSQDREVEGALSLVTAYEVSGRWQFGLEAAGWMNASEVGAGQAPAVGTGSVGYGLAAALREHVDHPAVERLALLTGRRTRWDAVRGVDRSAGRLVISGERPVTPPPPQSEVRQALAVAPWPANEAQFVTAKEPAALSASSGRDVVASVWCQPLKAVEPEPGCTIHLAVDGVDVATATLPARTMREVPVPALAPGRHDVQVSIDDPGRTSALSVRFHEAGARAALRGVRDTPGFVAVRGEPVALSVAGPATLALELRDLDGGGDTVDLVVAGPGGQGFRQTARLAGQRDGTVNVRGASDPVALPTLRHLVLPTEGVWTVQVAPNAGAVLVRGAVRQETAPPTVVRPGPMWREIPPQSEPFDWPVVPPMPAPIAAGPSPLAWRAGTFSVGVGFGRQDLDQQGGAAAATADRLETTVAWRAQVLPRRLWLRVEPAWRTMQGEPSVGGSASALYRFLGPDLRLLAAGQAFSQTIDGQGALGSQASLRAYRPTRLPNGAYVIPSIEAVFRTQSLGAAPVATGVDPDVYNAYTTTHPFALRGVAFYRVMPAQDLVAYATLTAVTNADLRSLDQAGLTLLGRGILHPGQVPFAYEGRVRPVWRFADADRPTGYLRTSIGGTLGTYVRMGDIGGLWVGAADDVYVSAGQKPENVLLLTGRLDVSGGRALRDRLPIEEDFFDLLAMDRWGVLDEEGL